MKHERIKIEPEVFRWLRKSSGYTQEELSKKSRVSLNVLSLVEEGKKGLTFTQIKKLARIIKRPTTAFLLSKPPEELPLPRDFRRVFVEEIEEGKFSKDTLLAIRRARRFQDTAGELMVPLGMTAEPRINKISLDDNPNPFKIAQKERINSHIQIDEQCAWRDSYEAFKKWREFIESKNILVFQIKMPIDDARGFSLIKKEPYVIVINSSDSIEARIFTLFHEYAHILVDKAGICIPEAKVIRKDSFDFKVEWWCNSFAAEFLLPLSYVREHHTLFEDTTKLGKLSRKLKISKSAILTRSYYTNLISHDEYNRIIENFRRKKLEKLEEKKGGWITPDKKCLREKGEKYVSTIFDATNKNLISYNTALDYLGIKLKYLDRVQELTSK